MSPELARLLVLAGTGYLAAGFVFALVFAARLAARVDPAAARGSLGFRLLTLPGATILWPVLALRLVKNS